MKAALILALLASPSWAIAQEVPEPANYRMDDYRAPVPDTLRGAQVVDAQAAYDLWHSGSAAFIDVLPHAPRPDNLPEGTIWYDKPRQSIPGALWLPNVGYGAIAEETAAYFKHGLEVATGGDKDHAVVIFCLADCWMSWNAAKRALDYGYSRVIWMPDGTDAWGARDYPTEALTVEPAP